MKKISHFVIKFVVAALIVLGFSSASQAHETTRSYVTLTRDAASVTANFRIAFRDIEVAVWMDENLDGNITWGETKQRLDAIAAYVGSGVSLDAGGPCDFSLASANASTDASIDYLDLNFAAECPDTTGPLTIISRLFAEIDPDHRMFLTANVNGTTTTLLLSAANPDKEVSIETGGPFSTFLSYFISGLEHLFGGPDHLVFLFVLMLPAIASGQSRRNATIGVVAALTGFTLAHAATLTAAATELLQPPPSIIEILIAVSIVITALDNVRPFIPAPRSAVAGFFGIIHGFGFASALGVLQLSGRDLAVALLGFNLGIEVAQIAVVLIALPLMYLIGFERILLLLGSAVSGMVGLFWIWQRTEM